MGDITIQLTETPKLQRMYLADQLNDEIHVVVVDEDGGISENTWQEY